MSFKLQVEDLCCLTGLSVVCLSTNECLKEQVVSEGFSYVSNKLI
jgi:hypothetical protein